MKGIGFMITKGIHQKPFYCMHTLNIIINLNITSHRFKVCFFPNLRTGSVASCQLASIIRPAVSPLPREARADGSIASHVMDVALVMVVSVLSNTVETAESMDVTSERREEGTGEDLGPGTCDGLHHAEHVGMNVTQKPCSSVVTEESQFPSVLLHGIPRRLMPEKKHP